MAIINFLALFTGASFLLAGCAGGDLIFNGSLNGLPKQFQERQLLVTLPESLKPQWQSIGTGLGNKHGLVKSGEFPLSSIGVDCLVYKVDPKQNLEQILRQLQNEKQVVLAQKNQVFSGIQSGENDEYASISYAPRLIRADLAHTVATGKGIGIAVVDTGLEKEHPDLKGRIVKTANFVEGGEQSFARDRHGTAVTGIIGARANDSIGIYGVAPDAEISLYKACWYPDNKEAGALCSSWTLAKALDAAIQQGVKVINLSLAGPEDALLAKLIQAAHEKGIIIAAAALEKQDRPGFPAALPEVIPVISADTEGKVKPPSWLSALPDVAVAPGVEILTTVPKEAYDFVSGSSLATAHISGVIALLLELKPDIKAGQVKQFVVNASRAGNPSQLKTVDVCMLLQQVDGKVRC